MMKRLVVGSLSVVALLGRSEVGTPRSSVWFEPNRGQVLGRTQFVGRTQGAFLYMTGGQGRSAGLNSPYHCKRGA